MKILCAAAEAAPLSKVGGLGDVVGSLPHALAALGHDVRVVIPHTGAVAAERFGARVITRFQVAHQAGPQTAVVSEAHHAGLTYYLIAGPPIPKANRVYGTSIREDGPKFIFFSLAALGLCRALDWAPDILHAHDAHLGPAVYWLATDGLRDPFFQNCAAVFTIHNLGYLNAHAGRYLREYGLAPSDAPHLPDWAREALMGLGLAHAEVINAVSPGYAREILTPEFGCGLEKFLRTRRDRLSGILNGLDLAEWNPATDPALAAPYDRRRLADRAINKLALQNELGLAPAPRTPLLGVVSRLDTQKGFDIAGPALRHLLETDVQLVVLGTGLPEIEKTFKQLARQFKDRVSLNLGFDGALARRIYGGADLLLIPSRYEPCGLTQLIAMRYGAVPVARRVGGLADTIVEARSGTGFLFRDYNPEAMVRAVRRALRLYAEPRRWRAWQRRGMRLDFSWARSAQAYQALYQTAQMHRQAARARLTQWVGPKA